MKKTLSVLLAFLMLLMTFSACGTKDPSPTETTETSGSVTESVTSGEAAETVPAETLRAEAKDSLPEDLNLGGRDITILGLYDIDYDIIGGEEVTGELVMDAVYTRTASVADRLNVNIVVQESSASSWQNYSEELNRVIMSGDDAWQIVFAQGNSTIESNRDNLFLNLADAPYLDYDQPWWWNDAMDELSFDGKTRKYLVGDIALTNFIRAGSMYFNKNIYSESIGNPDDLYQLVLDGNWTVDKMTELSEQAYSDLNGNGVADHGDVYGFLLGGGSYVQIFDYAFDVARYHRDENGYPVIEYDQQRAQTAVDKLYKLLYETKGNAYSSSELDYSFFANRGTFFFGSQLRAAIYDDLKGMSDDYGIIPYPKLDEDQEDYENLLFNSSSLVCVPITCGNVDESCAVIEAMCAESYRSVIEVFYETALKTKYSRDSFSGQCIDIIRDVTSKNLVYEYHGQFGAGTLITGCITAGNTNLASKITAVTKAANKAISIKIQRTESGT